MKRPSLLSQRSRFSFSDPFSNDSPLSQQQSQQQQQQPQQPQQHSTQKHSPQQCNQQQVNSSIPLSSQGQVIGLHSNHSHQDLSVESTIQTSDIGKSFLLRDSTEINEKIWGTSGIPSSINGYMSTPQPSTPTLEWGNTSASQHGSSFFYPLQHRQPLHLRIATPVPMQTPAPTMEPAILVLTRHSLPARNNQ